MRITTRHLCLAVLLALLVGHASFAVHAASHGLLDVAECQLCISYGYTSEAPPGEIPFAITPARDSYPAIDAVAVSEARDVVPFLQRGPPVPV